SLLHLRRYLPRPTVICPRRRCSSRRRRSITWICWPGRKPAWLRSCEKSSRRSKTMLRAIVLSGAVLALLPGQAAEPPPLTPEQRAQIGALATDTHRELTRLRALLEERQQVLTAVYSDYVLDEQRVTQLENEILEAQRQ